MARHTTHRGISLMEVLISIGILAIGLTSVVALVPAGRFNAGQAVIFDRANATAQNALADAVTRGWLKMHTLGIASGSTAGMLVIDTATTAAALGVTRAEPQSLGTYATDGASVPAPAAVINMTLQLRDDLLLQKPSTEDDLPLYRNYDGVRAFEGRFTCLLALTPLATVLEAGRPALLTAVVFHSRQTDQLAVDAVVQPDFSLAFAPLPDRTRQATFTSGGVFFTGGRFYQARSVTYDESGNAHVLLSGTTTFTTGTTVKILPDAVGLAERIVTLEGSGPYSR
jgi:type II secretory pathway pseudopilin PulG